MIQDMPLESGGWKPQDSGGQVPKDVFPRGWQGPLTGPLDRGQSPRGNPDRNTFSGPLRSAC